MNNSKSIFLIEDDRDDQEFFISALNEIDGANLLDIAENGRAALDKLERLVVLPDLIFTDINMPVMNGIECLTEIIKNPHLRKIPVVILSSSIGQPEFLYKLGAKVCIEKTSDSKSLSYSIAEAIILSSVASNKVDNKTGQFIN